MLSIAKSSLTVPTNGVVGIGDHAVVGDLGDRAAGGERGEPRAAAAAQHAVDAVAVQQRAARGRARSAMPSASISTTASKSARARSAKGAARRTSAKSSSSRHVVARRRSATICCARMSSGATGGHDAVEPARAHARAAAPRTRPARRACVGKRRPFGVRAERVARAADALQERREAARRADLADQVDGADVDAELERRRRDERAQLARLQPLPRRAAAGPSRGCRGGRPTRSSPSRSPSWCATRSASRRVLTKTSVVRCSSTARRCRSKISPHCSCDATASSSLSGTSMARSSARRWPTSTIAAGRRAVGARRARARADEEPRDLLDRALRGREADALRAARSHERVEPLERERQVRAALVARQRVDLVDDHRRARGAAARGCARP